jgi:hypothetical protein
VAVHRISDNGQDRKKLAMPQAEGMYAGEDHPSKKNRNPRRRGTQEKKTKK